MCTGSDWLWPKANHWSPLKSADVEASQEMIQWCLIPEYVNFALNRMKYRVDFAISILCEVFLYIILGLRNYSANSERNCCKQTPCCGWRSHRAGTADARWAWKPSLFIMNNFVEWLKQLSKIILRRFDTQWNKIRDQCESDELVRSYDPIETDGTKTILISSCQIMIKSVSASKWNLWRVKCLVRNDISHLVRV